MTKPTDAPASRRPMDRVATPKVFALLVTLAGSVALGGVPAVAAGQGVMAEKSAAADPESTIEVTHLGNEGFLLIHGEQTVLIDALFGEGLDNYPVVPKAVRREVENATGRFAGVDLVLVSHEHSDHFGASEVARHLRANPSARLISTLQVADAVQAEGIDAQRISGFWPAAGDQETVEHAGIQVTALRLHHGRSSAQNLGLLVELGGIRVIHLGDTSVTADEIESLDLGNRGIDVALVPYWYFDSDNWAAVLDLFGDAHLVAMHFPTPDAPASYFGERKTLPAQIRACQDNRPEAWMAVESGETRRFSDSVSDP